MPTKDEILQEIRSEWLLLERLLAGLSEAQMTTPGVIADWSIKDMLVHLSAWQKLLLERLGAALFHQPARYPPVRSQEDVDLLNARFFTEGQARPLPAVLMEYRSLYSGVLTVVEALDEAVLAGPMPIEWIEDAPTVWEMVRANTSDHYREHRQQIEAWLARQEP
jgi:hypothetical protein